MVNPDTSQFKAMCLTNLHACVAEPSADSEGFVGLVVAVATTRASGAAVLATKEVLEPLEQLRVSIEEGPGQLNQFGPADDLLVEQDQAAKEVLVDFGAAQCHSHLQRTSHRNERRLEPASIPKFEGAYLVEKCVLLESSISACFGQRHVPHGARQLGLLVGRRRLRDRPSRTLDGHAVGTARTGAAAAGTTGRRQELLAVLEIAMLQLLLLLLFFRLVGENL